MNINIDKILMEKQLKNHNPFPDMVNVTPSEFIQNLSRLDNIPAKYITENITTICANPLGEKFANYYITTENMDLDDLLSLKEANVIPEDLELNTTLNKLCEYKSSMEYLKYDTKYKLARERYEATTYVSESIYVDELDLIGYNINTSPETIDRYGKLLAKLETDSYHKVAIAFPELLMRNTEIVAGLRITLTGNVANMIISLPLVITNRLIKEGTKAQQKSFIAVIDKCIHMMKSLLKDIDSRQYNTSIAYLDNLYGAKEKLINHLGNTIKESYISTLENDSAVMFMEVEPLDDAEMKIYNELLKKWDTFKYGCNCFDYVEYGKSFLKSKGIKCDTYYIELDVPNKDSHTILVTKNQYGEYVYIEKSFEAIAGIYCFADLNSIFRFVTLSMFAYRNIKITTWRIPYTIYKYTTKPPHSYDECIQHVHDNGTVVTSGEMTRNDLTKYFDAEGAKNKRKFLSFRESMDITVEHIADMQPNILLYEDGIVEDPMAYLEDALTDLIFTDEDEISEESMMTIARIATELNTNYIVTEAGRIQRAANKFERGSQKLASKMSEKASNAKRTTVALKKGVEPFARAIESFVNKIKAMDNKERRERIITGQFRMRIFKMIRKCILIIATAKVGLSTSVVGFALSLIAIVVGIAVDRHIENSIRHQIIRELEAELDIVKEKIDDSRSDENKQNKYQLMRIKKKLETDLARVKHNSRASRAKDGSETKVGD